MRWISKGLLVMCISSMAPMGIVGQTMIGVRGGFSSATVTGDDLANKSRNSGFTVGGSVGFGLGGAFGLDVGAAYTQKGVLAKEGGTDLIIDIGYLELPVLARLTVPTGGRVTSHVSFGPVFGVEVGCEAEVTQIDLSMRVDCDDPSLDGGLETNSFDIGVLVAAGVSVGMGNRTRLSMDAMYNFGMRGIDSNDVLDPNRNRAFMVTWGLSYTIGG